MIFSACEALALLNRDWMSSRPRLDNDLSMAAPAEEVGANAHRMIATPAMTVTTIATAMMTPIRRR